MFYVGESTSYSILEGTLDQHNGFNTMVEKLDKITFWTSNNIFTWMLRKMSSRTLTSVSLSSSIGWDLTQAIPGPLSSTVRSAFITQC